MGDGGREREGERVRRGLLRIKETRTENCVHVYI